MNHYSPSFPGSAWERTPARLCLAALLVIVGYDSALAADPQINAMTPYGLQRGTEATFTFTGNGFEHAKEILFYTPGFTVKSLESPADATLKAVVAVASDCQLGIHALRVRSTTGISGLKTFTVGNLPEVPEIEPNTNFNQAQPIPLNVTVSGVVQAEDLDHFAVELKKGDRLVEELEGLRLGTT